VQKYHFVHEQSPITPERHMGNLQNIEASSFYHSKGLAKSLLSLVKANLTIVRDVKESKTKRFSSILKLSKNFAKI